MKAKKFTAFIAALAMIISILPTSLITASADEDPIRITSMRFRAHPQTYSIFDKSTEIPTNLLWTEFNTTIDHSQDYNKTTRTYHIGDGYYQIEIFRPKHGPAGQTHPEASIVPENDISGIVKDEIEENKTHRYHGWKIGEHEDDTLFQRDDTIPYQVGEYTAKLQKLETTEAPESFDATKTLPKQAVSEKSIKLVHVTYTLSEQDKADGYKLKCPMEENPALEIKELAAVGDMPAIIAPKADSTDVHTEGTKKIVSGWRVVKNEEGTELSGAIGDYLRDDGADGFADENKDDNEIKLQAILTEPKSYAYEIMKDEAGTESAFPSVPDSTPAPASFNTLASDTEEDKKIEYDPTGAADSLTLYIVNKGNQREYVQVESSSTFNFKLENVNTGEYAKKKYSEGGLVDDGSSSSFYIPSKADAQKARDEHSEEWKNYAKLVITPKNGLSVGTYTAEIKTRCYNSRNMVWNSNTLTITISPKTVKIAPRDTEKEYGRTLTDADIICDVYDDEGDVPIEQGKTAAELGVKIQSDGMNEDAAIGGGDTGDNSEIYYYDLAQGQSNSNYEVTLKEDLKTGITVTKTTPGFNNVSASLIKDGNTLSQSKLKGDYVNKNSHKTVDGEWKWVDENEVINEHLEDGTTKVITRQYQFTPTDTTHYDTPQPGTVNITVSGLRDVKLSATGKTLTKTYNGQPQAPSFSWARGSDGPREDQITVKYKKVEDSDTSFKEDEDYSQYQEVAPTDAGIYKVYATCPAYNNMFAAGVATAIFTINPYPLELNLSGSVVDKMYDGTKTAKIDASKVTFKQKPTAEDDVRVKAEAFTTAEFDSKSFDPYYPKTVRVVVKGEGALEGNDAKNYILNDTTLSTTGRIMWQRPVKLELKKPITKKYGTAYTITSDDYREAESQPSSGGLVEGETVDAVRATVTALKNGIDGTSAEATVGDYEVTASVPNASDYNYSVTNDPLGTLTVEKADPTPEGAVTAENGKTGNKLSTVKLDGTFINSNNVNMSVGGDLEWEEPDTLLEEGTKSYKWTFTPTDTANYNPISGSVDVTATEKEPAPIALTVPENVTYNGQQHAATATSTVDEAQITIEYAKNEDIELHTMSLPDEELTWQQIPPKEAGTYYVRATVQAIGDYAQNEEIKSMTILQAEPVGTVTAGSVDRGAYLSDSRLTYSFTGVDDTPLTGSAQWSSQGANPPTEITVDPDTEYTWEFDPEDNNYKTVTGTAKVEINVDTRKAEAKIYNLPKDYDTIGDYAYVNVDGTNLKAGDTVQFYADESGPNPESKAFDITDEMHGWTLVNLDDDALKAEGGMLYLNIKGSSEATKVEYKPEIGFIVNPTQIYIKVNDTADVSVTPSDNSYVVNSVTWTAEPETTATVQGTAADNGMTAKVTGVDDGVASLTATAVFKHPDTEKPNATITLTKPATVTVTEEQAPDYTYTTNAATNVTATGATLKGHVEIKTYGTSITPKAVCLFEIWKKGSSDEKRSIGKDSQQTLTQSGDYDFTLDDLEPNTTYEYRAIGIKGNTMTPGEPQEFTTEKATYAVKFYGDEEGTVITVDGSPLGEDKTVTKTDGEKLTFTVTPPAGMVIADVLANGVSLTANEEDGSYGITVDKDYNVWLSFKKATHTVTFRNDEGAVITVDGAPLDADNTVIKNEGDKLTFTVEVPEGLELVGVTANGDALAAKEDGSYEITVDKDYEIAFSYRNKVIENVETEITSVEVTANGATVGSVRARNGLLIVASYTADNKLMDVNTKQLALSKDETTDMIALNTVGAASVKAFIWDSMLHPEPLCEPKSETVTSE